MNGPAAGSKRAYLPVAGPFDTTVMQFRREPIEARSLLTDA